MIPQRVLGLLCAWLVLVTVSKAQPLAPAEAPIPAASREWTGADYEVLDIALAQGRLALPQFSSQESKALMRRMVSRENLNFQLNKTIPIQFRLQDFMKLHASIANIAKRYIAEANNGKDVHAELAALLSFLVRASASGASLVSEWIVVMPRDVNYEARMKGLGLVKSGITDVLLGAVTSLNESIYSGEDKSLILASMADSIEPFKAYLASDVKAELRKRLETHRGRGTSTDDKNLNRLIRALDAQ